MQELPREVIFQGWEVFALLDSFILKFTFVCVEVKGQLCGIGFLFALRGFQRLSSGHQACVALPTSHLTSPRFCLLRISVAQAGLEISFTLPLSPECWDYGNYEF